MQQTETRFDQWYLKILREGWKKRNNCNKCIWREILWFFVQRTETRFVQRCLKISGKAEKKTRNDCNKCILKGILWFFVQRTETRFVNRLKKFPGKAEKKVQQTVTNVFDREYYDSLCNELQQGLSNDI